MLDLSICVVNYKADQELERCLASIKKFTKGISYETVVIDNSRKNRWYSGGNNLVLKQAQGGYVLIFNPDCYLRDNAFRKMVFWMDQHPKAGIIEPAQIRDDGWLAPTGSRLPRWWVDLVELTGLSHVFGNVERKGRWRLSAVKRFRQEELDRRKSWRTEVVSGAAMMLRREVLDEVGGFDERMKLYYADTDLCRRLLETGREIWHLGEAVIWHSMGRSTRQLSWQECNSIYARDAREYYRKWGEPAGGWILWAGMKVNQWMINTNKQISE